MIEVRQTEVFSTWFTKLRDGPTQRRIQARIDRLQMGNPGQYRVLTDGAVLVILLCGGDKATQDSDIKTALALAQGLST